MSGATSHRQAVDAAWADYGDKRSIVGSDEVSANVSTNRVYRLHLDDGSTVISKVSSYGSYFLFVEDHEQLDRCARLLGPTRFNGMLAEIWSRDGRIFTWYNQHIWAVFYDDVPRRDSLPRVLTVDQIANLATEIAEFHLACTEIAPALPSASKTIKSDAIHLLDLLESPFAPRNFDMPPESIAVLWKHTHPFLERLVEVGYDEWPKIPILIDWNLGNFSVETAADGRFRLYSRWDYDWFRIEPRLLDFYFLSRVSSSTGDRTRFTYGPHTLVEPSFLWVPRGLSQRLPDEHRRARLPCPRSTGSSSSTTSSARVLASSATTCASSSAATRCSSYLPALDTLDISPLLRL